MTAAPFVKICGVRTEQDVEVCLREQVAFVGLNFFAPSPRCIGWQHARTLRRRLTPATRAVAVMVRPTADEMSRAVHEVGADVIQIHGLDDDYLQTFVPPPVPVWPAHGIGAEADMKQVQDHVRRLRSLNACVGALLVDAKVEGTHGGTGVSPPWPLLGQTSWEFPLVLAGGLTPDNVALAVTAVRPFAVDVASGVESTPGIKDAGLIKAFVRAVRTGAASGS